MKLKFTNKMKGASKSKVNNVTNAKNRQCLSADGFSLLPSALRPCLFCLVLMLVFGFTTLGVFNSSTVFATTSTLTVNIASSISLDLNPIYPNGTFASSSTSDNTISVKTDNFTGYTLGIAAKTADSNALTYTNNDVVVATIPSIASAVSATNYADNTYATTNHLNNTWGFRPSKYNSVDNTVTNNYYPAPTSTEENNIVLDTTSAANPSTFNNYNIAIGARVDMATQPGAYNNTFVITVVANAIAYSITYNKNTTDTVTNMPANVSNATTLDTSITLGGAPSRDGYDFVGWCTVAVVDGGTCNSPNTQYAAGGSYTIDQVGGVNDLALYAMWKEQPKITFKAGDNIETVIVADGSQNWKPFYAKAGTDVVLSNAAANTKYIVTVVPNANYKLDSWTRDTEAGTLASSTLLTTTYIVGNDSETLTANGISGTYTDKMKDFTKASCTAAGNNVTDERDGKSYTVAKFGSYCYMLSNLRLEGGTTLNSSTSNVSNTFTLPDQTTWTSSSQNHYCEARMRYIGDEYYYNWYAAKANPTTGVSSSSSCANTTRDNASLGSICPKNWTLPEYTSNDLSVDVFNVGGNPGMLVSTGGFNSGSQGGVGSGGRWWSSARYDISRAYYLLFNGSSANRGGSYKSYGSSVRCMRSS